MMGFKPMIHRGLWEKDWFIDLPNEQKLTWFYILNHCDNAGVWSVQKRVLTSIIGDVDLPNFFANMAEHVHIIDKKTVWITEFCKFQYEKGLKPRLPFHIPAFRSLRKHGLMDWFEEDENGVFWFSWKRPSECIPLAKEDLAADCASNDRPMHSHSIGRHQAMHGHTMANDPGKDRTGKDRTGKDTMSSLDYRTHENVLRVVARWKISFSGDATVTEAKAFIAERLGLKPQRPRSPVTPWSVEQMEIAIDRYAAEHAAKVESNPSAAEYPYRLRNFVNSRKAYCDTYAADDYKPKAESGAKRRLDYILPEDGGDGGVE